MTDCEPGRIGSHMSASAPHKGVALMTRLHSYPALRRLIGLSRYAVRRLESAGKFPRRVYITKNINGWREDEIAAWIAELARGEAGRVPKRSQKPTAGSLP